MVLGDACEIVDGKGALNRGDYQSETQQVLAYICLLYEQMVGIRSRSLVHLQLDQSTSHLELKEDYQTHEEEQYLYEIRDLLIVQPLLFGHNPLFIISFPMIFGLLLDVCFLGSSQPLDEHIHADQYGDDAENEHLAESRARFAFPQFGGTGCENQGSQLDLPRHQLRLNDAFQHAGRDE